MKIFFLFMTLIVVGCQEKTPTVSTTTTTTGTSTQTQDDLLLEKEEGCTDAELSEAKIVEQAMKPAKADTGALQGVTDCEVN